MTKKYDKMVVKRSDKSGKKYMAVFTDSSSGRTKTTHFGASGMTDYLLSKDKDRRARYRSRHKKDLTTRDPTRAGFLSYYLLGVHHHYQPHASQEAGNLCELSH